MVRKRPSRAVGVGAATVLATILLMAAGCRGDIQTAGDFQTMRFGPGMMGYGPTGAGEPVRDLDAAKRQAETFADQLDLLVGEVMQFTNNYYAELIE